MIRATLLLAPIGLSLMLAGCSTPQTRLRNGLVQAGISEPVAECMAERMTDRLSLGQLRKLRDFAEARKADSRAEFLRGVRALDDAEIVTVTASSAALCATGLAG